jgi:hypothetical protein
LGRTSRKIRYWDRRATDLREQEAAGKQPRMNAEAAQRRADEFAARKDRRLAELRTRAPGRSAAAARHRRLRRAPGRVPAQHGGDGDGQAAQLARPSAAATRST